MNIKKKLTKAFLVQSILIFWSANASLAAENKVKMGGIYDFQAIHPRRQHEPKKRPGHYSCFASLGILVERTICSADFSNSCWQDLLHKCAV